MTYDKLIPLHALCWMLTILKHIHYRMIARGIDVGGKLDVPASETHNSCLTHIITITNITTPIPFDHISRFTTIYSIICVARWASG